MRFILLTILTLGIYPLYRLARWLWPGRRSWRHRRASRRQRAYLADLIDREPDRAAEIGISKHDLGRLTMLEASGLLDEFLNE